MRPPQHSRHSPPTTTSLPCGRVPRGVFPRLPAHDTPAHINARNEIVDVHQRSRPGPSLPCPSPTLHCTRGAGEGQVSSVPPEKAVRLLTPPRPPPPPACSPCGSLSKRLFEFTQGAMDDFLCRNPEIKRPS